ncbi:ribonuclease T2 family protein [Aureimonas phyllosphaerae]|uniref:Ribonuclease T2 n=1 Tax=Aureimonas phyllosphaerae TaxID=1166078 RepID=A0A7W6FTG4_9HYPH|nr:ribonuclease T2 [Aureimonas phyllosphaerae]MBB3934981.1 ribonuclease T2 [Aureimonas phyllosphaerae]MBB3958989.1 ribonuclease T2 [Aureimonas phyllosphaerae]SFF40092.1 ribonuclease T2 [Aureimonas phyllosphaerae]
MSLRTVSAMIATAAALSVAAPVAARAQVPMVGVFTAEASCFATPSIRSDDNPGRIVTEPGRSYDLIGRNASPGSHYLIRVPGAEPERRWVAFGCGRVEDASQSAEGTRPDKAATPAAGRGQVDRYVLAASWQPAFCETRPSVRECRTGGAAGNGFSLHGLWPQPRGREYCGVPEDVRRTDERGEWRRLPDYKASAGTRRALAEVMPGVQSGLDRHEWWSHGTCFRGDAETYFSQSIRLLEDLNRSSVRRLFETAIGRELSADEVRASFDEAFGRGAGRRVLIDCVNDTNGEPMIRELRVELEGDLSRDVPLRQLIVAADETGRGCRSGRVDAPGFG